MIIIITVSRFKALGGPPRASAPHRVATMYIHIVESHWTHEEKGGRGLGGGTATDVARRSSHSPAESVAHV